MERPEAGVTPEAAGRGGDEQLVPAAGGTAVLRVTDMSKTFTGTRALDRVSFDVAPGEVHALLGHNGSGKSTLIKVLSGYHLPDPGSGPVEVAGAVLRHGDPDAAHRSGLRFIHQELGLVDALTVLENLRLGTEWETGRGGRIRWARERRAATERLERVGLHVHPEVTVADLSPVQRTQLAVARALQDEEAARVLILDEPTATLPSAEVDRLFGVIRGVVADGLGVVYISHRLEELDAIADRVTVLRDGRVAATGPRSEFAHDRLVQLIVGTEGTAPSARRRAVAEAAASDEGARLRFDGVAAGELVDASFSIRPGEVVGMAGLAGSGVNDVPAVLLGRIPLEAGEVHVEGERVERLEPTELMRRRVSVLPSARPLKSIATLNVRENLTLSDLRSISPRGRLRHRRERAVARDLVRRFNVLPAEPERPLAELSGGNQQKVCVARWLRTEPHVLVLDEPTQGVDIGGKAEILELLRTAARDGVAVLLCSSDSDELALVCDRVLIVRGGRIGDELVGEEVTREAVAEACYRGDAAHA